MPDCQRASQSLKTHRSRQWTMLTSKPNHKLLDTLDPAPITRLLEGLESQDLLDESPAVCCKRCNNHITELSHQLPVNNQLYHQFVNPSGLEFEIVCFELAPGCSVSGKPTSDHTWFPGYQWQYAYCNQCNEHVGWYYNHNEWLSFFGLITAKLIGL